MTSPETESEYLARLLNAHEQMLASLTQGMIECSIGVEVCLDHIAAGLDDDGRVALARKLTDGKKKLFEVLREWSDGIVDAMAPDPASTPEGMARPE